MDELLRDLEQAAKTPAKQRVAKISGIVDDISSRAFEDGLSTSQLSKLVDTVTLPNTLDQASSNALISCLYPAARVPDAVIVNIVASLGHGTAKPSHSVQAALLRWLIMVYDVLENQKTLSQLYAVLFNLMDTLVLRKPLCHILSLITRRKHVRPYRIQLLMELTRQFGGSEAPLVGLLRVYKDYYPDVIIGDAVSGRARVFTHPDEEWRQRVREIQEVHAMRLQSLDAHKRTFKVSRRNGIARRKTSSSLIPNVQTSNALETSITLEEIENVDDFVQKLERIEPPNQLVSVIGDPLLQKFMQLRSHDDFTRRIDMWLFAFFEERLSDGDDNTSQILEMLQAVLEYTRYTKILPVACATYLKSILPSWNGVSGRAIILGLCTYLIPEVEDTFTTVRTIYLKPVEDALLSTEDPSIQLHLLQFYTTLLGRWVVSALTETSKLDRLTPFITELLDHAILLTLVISQNDDSQAASTTILAFYKSMLSAFSHAEINSRIRVTPPPSQLVYTLQFTSSLATLSGLCEVLATYKRTFEVVMASKTTSKAHIAHSYQKEYVNQFNGYLMDICNCIWRSKGLQTGDPNAHGCLVDPNVASALTTHIAATGDLTLPSLFSLSVSPSIGLLAITYFRELEDTKEDEIEKRHAGPVTAVSLRQLELDGGLKMSWQEYRLGVLQYLEKSGVNGIGDLMYSTMKNLMSARTRIE